MTDNVDLAARITAALESRGIWDTGRPDRCTASVYAGPHGGVICSWVGITDPEVDGEELLAAILSAPDNADWGDIHLGASLAPGVEE